MALSDKMRTRLTGWVRAAASLLGRRLKSHDGRTLDRAFLFCSKGGIKVVGISPYSCLRPVGRIQPKMTYWKQEIVWEETPPPDFRGIKATSPPTQQPHVCHAVITHLDAASNNRLLAEWNRLDPASTVLLVHGGARRDFDELPPDAHKVFVDDERLRTKVHAKEKQEYHSILRAVAAWLPEHPWITHVHLVEYDCVPLVPELGRHLVDFLQAEQADLAGSFLSDLSGSIHPHYLNFLADPQALSYLDGLSSREDKQRVLAMLGCTSMWTADCLREVAALEPPSRIYLEIAFPTLAHHLGWRVRGFPAAQLESISFQSDLSPQAEAFRKKGSWMIHPCKSMWKPAT